MHHLEKDNSISSLDMIIYRLSFLSFKRIVEENRSEERRVGKEGRDRGGAEQ